MIHDLTMAKGLDTYFLWLQNVHWPHMLPLPVECSPTLGDPLEPGEKVFS